MAKLDRHWDESWEQASASSSRVRSSQQIVLRLLRQHGAAGAALDVGAGAGGLLRVLHGGLPSLRLTAQESSDRARAELAELPFVQDVIDGSLCDERNPLSGRSWDVVLAVEFLERLEDDERALKRLAAALTPGGLLLLAAEQRPDLWTRLDVSAGHRRRYEPSSLAARCQDLGLQIEADLGVGALFYNTWLTRSGLLNPYHGGEQRRSSGLRRLASSLAASLFTAELRFSSRYGARGFVVARKR